MTAENKDLKNTVMKNLAFLLYGVCATASIFYGSSRENEVKNETPPILEYSSNPSDFPNSPKQP